jgi:hypothetical protein
VKENSASAKASLLLQSAAAAGSSRSNGKRNQRFEANIKRHEDEMERLIRNISARIQVK